LIGKKIADHIGMKKNEKIFKKPIDKCKNVCYIILTKQDNTKLIKEQTKDD
jgi:hypothetical protein